MGPSQILLTKSGFISKLMYQDSTINRIRKVPVVPSPLWSTVEVNSSCHAHGDARMDECETGVDLCNAADTATGTIMLAFLNHDTDDRVSRLGSCLTDYRRTFVRKYTCS
jgi:hypothetical protein